MSKPVKYHCHNSCNNCGGENEVSPTDSLDGRLLECRTECKSCGFSDNWAHGFFESSQNIESKCKTYSFNKGVNNG